jgi:hypothetical protein
MSEFFLKHNVTLNETFSYLDLSKRGSVSVLVFVKVLRSLGVEADSTNMLLLVYRFANMLPSVVNPSSLFILDDFLASPTCNIQYPRFLNELNSYAASSPGLGADHGPSIGPFPAAAVQYPLAAAAAAYGAHVQYAGQAVLHSQIPVCSSPGLLLAATNCTLPPPTCGLVAVAPAVAPAVPFEVGLSSFQTPPSLGNSHLHYQQQAQQSQQYAQFSGFQQQLQYSEHFPVEEKDGNDGVQQKLGQASVAQLQSSFSSPLLHDQLQYLHVEQHQSLQILDSPLDSSTQPLQIELDQEEMELPTSELAQALEPTNSTMPSWDEVARAMDIEDHH